MPAPTEVSVLVLVLYKSLAWDWFHGGLGFGPTLAGVAAGLGLVPWMSLAWSWSCGGGWSGSDPVEVTGLGLVL